MSEPVIKVTQLSKQYDLGLVGTGTLSRDLNRFWAKIQGKPDPYATLAEINDRTKAASSGTILALNTVSFNVNRGEVLGIIGKNGAGKSTLLKILSQITAPSSGDIKIKGRVASLLEVGTGMHPEMTARQNIYLNGSIMGMTRKEVSSKLEEIIEFAGIRKYIDTPLKRFSSGMKVRLGFAVAAFLEPEILIVDEVLAVGDAEFQKRAVGKIKDVSEGEGRTVLFVSHNMAAVKSLCTRGIVLEKGEVIFDGSSKNAVEKYLQSNSQSNVSLENLKNDYLEVTKFLVIGANSKDAISISEEITVLIEFKLNEKLPLFNLSLVLYDESEVAIFNSISPVEDIESGKHKFEMKIPENFLNDTGYNLRVLFVSKSKAVLDSGIFLHFETIEDQARKINWFGKFTGLIRPDLTWEKKKI